MTTNNIINFAAGTDFGSGSNSSPKTTAIYFITGSKKNAGKTTFLNYLVNSRREKAKPAYLSIGIDGESRDQVFDTPKPRIYAQKGDLVVSTTELLSANLGDLEFLHVFDFSTCLGRLVIARIKRDCYIELAGPDSNRQLNEILNYLHSECEVDEIYIDGAVNRVTQVASVQNASFYHVSSVDPLNLTSSVNEIKKLKLLFDLAQKTPPEDCYFLEGAFTANKLKQLPKNVKKLLLADFSKVFLTYNELSILLQDGYELYFKNSYKLKAFVVNLFDVSEKAFLENIKGIERDLIVFNPYLGK